ncbi:uncharacterized protein SPPG_01856 [Spizellomyces punctatus DAOM BR117]|uniref:Uncharacterized protein n=1 Tax=Spizellomyces punctatus (strain DAOM BR117) TaxID=645134 RepID=A0A0L0HP79_SPIPD|nr:uncharacterized protein SPPG_01856 [Spizellomyces punctatus DAOM BR117]KND02775.1 hypothetical protein SPPG_01856 [Spizellomyces punctatus DAOM BR117]|eukprot:XP_016610814.1 hypothetical protein SPPG_01856 [Spizellomyces punctatus DAOM BR117]
MDETFSIEETSPEPPDLRHDVSGGSLPEPSEMDPPRKRRRRKHKRKRVVLAPGNFLSGFFFTWVFRLVQMTRSMEDAGNLSLHLRSSESAKVTGDDLEKTWRAELGRQTGTASLLRALHRAFGLRYYALALWKCSWAAFTWLGAYWLLKQLVLYCETSGPVWRGHLYAVGLFISHGLGSLCFHQLTIQCTRIGIQCRAALMVLIYRKSLRLSYVRGGVGDIVNLISNECNRVAEAAVNWHFAWSAGIECCVIIALAAVEVGVAVLPAMVLVLFMLLPLQYILAKRASTISYKTTALFTKRVHLMSEIFTVIRLIKSYAWESFYEEKITAARKKEIGQMRKALTMKIGNFIVVFIAPVVAVLACMTTYHFIHGARFEAATVFTILSLFNTLRYPLLMLPSAVRTISGAQNSVQRLEEFFMLPEIDAAPKLEPHPSDADICMEIKGADFMWDGDIDHPHIEKLDLVLRRRQLIAVVGDLGSGKSLLAAIMGQIKRTAGSVSTYGTCGYVPLEPWLLDNASLRDNVLFGVESDEGRYHEAVRVAGLMQDFISLPNGDEEFVSELELTRSQRQRISLARCLYHQPDIALLEDCLTDFDTKNAKRIFTDCVKGHMLSKMAVVMVTQQKQFLSECDMILVMKSGTVVEQGTFDELKARNVIFNVWATDLIQPDDDTIVLSDIKPAESLGPHIPKPKRPPPRKRSPLATAEVITAEQTENTRPPVDASGPDLSSVDLTIRRLNQLRGIEPITDHTISQIIERNQLSVLTGTPSRPPVNFANQDVVTRTIEANQLTVHAVQTYDTVGPTATSGLIDPSPESQHPLRPYVQYLQEADGILAGAIVVGSFFVVATIRVLSDVWVAWFVEGKYSLSEGLYIGIYALFCSAIAVGVLVRGYAFSAAVLSRSISLHNRVLQAVLRAPLSFYEVTPLGQILSHFARYLYMIDDFLPEAALQALSFGPIVFGTVILVSVVTPWFWATLPVYFFLVACLIHFCGDTEAKFKRLEASNKSPMFAHLSSTLEGLFSIRLYHAEDRFDTFNRTLIDSDHKALYSLMLVKTLLALYLDLIASLFVYICALFVVLFDVGPSQAGLAVSNALQLLLFLQWFVRILGEVHGTMSSVSAVVNFAECCPYERDARGNHPPPEWPLHGEIEFKNVVLRYNRYGVAVLKNVTFRIAPGEKIGVVGRSGSGKTTLLVSLLRMVELSEGDILIDGIDISKLRLADLRSRIAIIPQEPILLTGTIRSNLDPFRTCLDEELWKALQAVHLGQKIEEMPAKLETPITENGKAFTLTERQLFCIARAIINKSKVVVLDEPVMSMGHEADNLIHSVIATNFESCTVIVLASRFRFIVQMDRIMVMSRGRVVEFDTPISLLNDPKSKFSLMVSQTGEMDPVRLRKIAMAKGKMPPSKVLVDMGNDSGEVSQREPVRPFAPALRFRPPSPDTSQDIDKNRMPKSLKDLFKMAAQDGTTHSRMVPRPRGQGGIFPERGTSSESLGESDSGRSMDGTSSTEALLPAQHARDF